VSYEFEEILARAQRMRHGELKRLFRLAASAFANHLVRSSEAVPEAAHVPARLALGVGPGHRSGC